VKERRPEDLLGEWGIRDVTPPSMRERERLEADRDLNPLVGKRLRRRIRNFRAQADNYLASLGGPLPYMQRLRLIETETERSSSGLPRPTRSTRMIPPAGAGSQSAGTSARSTT
jgi:hypothetical protein